MGASAGTPASRPPFQRILIANRGEIAVRIIRACRELGISPAVVYSDADRAALHVQLADVALYIGDSNSLSSYLSIEKIVDAAKKAGADAVHPGYGFLAENANFASAVEAAGLTFIGPPPASIELMGSKTSAREAALRAGAPIVPGSEKNLESVDEALTAAADIRYPVMLKASAGGGGKGMRLVRSDDEMKSAFPMAAAEAQQAFGDGSLYIEKLIERPRHIEIQIVADRYGNVVHLGERECSVQRRHQKVIEECPASFNDAGLRERMGQAAIGIARTAGYVSLGTLEFLVDADRNFYFLEMNTRLQVEHPVTEMVTGIDLVHEQIRIAAGERLSITQGDVRWNGSAIECRIYAEDPQRGFMPSPGKITRLRTASGPGIREDSGVYEGWEVPIYYDPMISKLCAWGEDRQVAIARLRRAFNEQHIGGIRTTIPFFREVLSDDEFVSGAIDTGFIERFQQRQSQEHSSEQTRLAAAIAAASEFIKRARLRNARGPADSRTASRWKLEGRMSVLKHK